MLMVLVTITTMPKSAGRQRITGVFVSFTTITITICQGMHFCIFMQCKAIAFIFKINLGGGFFPKVW